MSINSEEMRTTSDLRRRIADVLARVDDLQCLGSEDRSSLRADLETLCECLQLIAKSPDRFFCQDSKLRYIWTSHDDLFGRSSSEVMGKTSFDLFTFDEAQRLTDIKRRVMETGESARAETHMAIAEEEHHFDVFYEPWRDCSGNVLGIAGCIRDITDLRLAKSETERMTRAIEMMPTAVILTNFEGRIEYVNPSILEMSGFDDTSELIGRNVFDFATEESRVKLEEDVLPALLLKGQWRGELPIKGKDKTYVVDAICALVRDDHGEPSYFMANYYNITDRKHAEEALILDEARLEALLRLNQMEDASIQEIMDFALEAGVKLTGSKLGYLAFVDEDEKTLTMHSWSKAALRDCKVARKRIVYPLETVGLWGEAVRQRRAIITNDYSSSYLRKGTPEGHADIMRYMSIPVFDMGRIAAVAGVGNKEEEYDESDVRQLTLLMSGMWRLIQRRKSEEELRKRDRLLEESQRTLSTLMSNLPGMAYRAKNDKDCTMEFVSDGCIELTGYHPQDLIGNRMISYAQLIHPDDREYVLGEIQDALTDKMPFRLIYRIKSKSFSGTKWVWEQGRGIFSSEGDLVALEGFITDITDRKLAEEALRRAHDELEKRVQERTAWLLRANENLHEEMAKHKKTEQELRQAQEAANAAASAKSQFLANMSHEIRTPMNAVIGMSGFLLETDLTPEQRDYVQTIRGSSDALLAIINDILDFSKIDEGKMAIERIPFDLQECIESSLELVAAKATEKGLELKSEMDEALPKRVMGDASRLRQVLANLLSNAVKFTDKGKVVLSTRFEGTKEIHFAVRDTGIGISDESMGRLFQSFSQGDTSTSKKYGGTGLGLAISKRFIELMGGQIWAESQLGRGSIFHFTIPAEAAPDGGDPRLEGKRVIVVSSESCAEDLVRHLESWGMQVSIAALKDAADMARKGSFDAAIIDMQTSEDDEPIQEIRKVTPIIALTSPGRQCAGTGQVSLSKPVKLNQLRSALLDVLMQKPSRVSSDLRILLAEDNMVNQKVALLMLKRLGYRADVACNGFEVLQALARQQYDVVLMDVQMPEMDGLEAARRVRAMKDINQPKILAMTAYALEDDREKCIQAGMDGYIRKPVQLKELRAALEGRAD